MPVTSAQAATQMVSASAARGAPATNKAEDTDGNVGTLPSEQYIWAQ